MAIIVRRMQFDEVLSVVDMVMVVVVVAVAVVVVVCCYCWFFLLFVFAFWCLFPFDKNGGEQP